MIIGHSLSDVDLPYFKEIKRNIGIEVEWNVYYFSENQKDIFREQLKK
jgi:hypothetical protein